MPNRHEPNADIEAGRRMEDAFTSLHRWCELAIAPWVGRLLHSAQEQADLSAKIAGQRSVTRPPPAW